MAAFIACFGILAFQLQFFSIFTLLQRMYQKRKARLFGFISAPKLREPQSLS